MRTDTLIDVVNDGDKLIVNIAGEIDHHSASKIREKIDNNIHKDIKLLIISLEKVNFMDTSGIGLILGRFKKTRELGISMKIVSIPEKIKRIIKLSGIQNLGILME